MWEGGLGGVGPGGLRRCVVDVLVVEVVVVVDGVGGEDDWWLTVFCCGLRGEGDEEVWRFAFCC